MKTKGTVNFASWCEIGRKWMNERICITIDSTHQLVHVFLAQQRFIFSFPILCISQWPHHRLVKPTSNLRSPVLVSWWFEIQKKSDISRDRNLSQGIVSLSTWEFIFVSVAGRFWENNNFIVQRELVGRTSLLFHSWNMESFPKLIFKADKILYIQM